MYNTIQEIQMVAKTAGIHRGPLGGPERFVTQHAQSAEHELHTRGDKRGRGQRRDTRQHFCDSRAEAHRAAHCGRQGTRALGRSLIGELTLHPVRVGRLAGMPTRIWHLGTGRARTIAAADGMGPVGAVGQCGLRRHAAVVEAGRRASTTRPIVSVRWRPTNRNPAQAQSFAPRRRRLRSRRCSTNQWCQRVIHWHLRAAASPSAAFSALGGRHVGKGKRRK